MLKEKERTTYLVDVKLVFIFVKQSFTLKKLTLENRFKNLVSLYTTDSEFISRLWEQLYSRYTEKHRTYHNLQHLKELFGYYDTYKDKLLQPNLVAFSIFYHDIIYNIWKKDNEEKSAKVALQSLATIVSAPELAIINEQIIATKTHEGNTNDTKFLLDFDLAILGQSTAVYQQYAKLIRAEYKLVPDFLYKKGRIKVLQHFIAKPFIYKTVIFKSSYEQNAKNNLQKELNLLQDGIK